jgi:hypothetical protein
MTEATDQEGPGSGWRRLDTDAEITAAAQDSVLECIGQIGGGLLGLGMSPGEVNDFVRSLLPLANARVREYRDQMMAIRDAARERGDEPVH